MKKIYIAVLLAASLGEAQAQNLFSGVLAFSETELGYRESLLWDELAAADKAMAANGFRLLDLETALVAKERRYWAIWSKGAKKGEMRKVSGWTDFVKMKREMDGKGYVMNAVKGYAISETDMVYIGIWEEGKMPHKVWKLDSRESIVQKTEEMARENFMLVEVEAILTPGKKSQYLVLYHLGTAVTPRSNVFMSEDLRLFNIDLQQRTKSGNRLIDYERIEEGGVVYHLGVYRRGTYEVQLLTELDKYDFDSQWETAEKGNLKLIDWEVRAVE